MEDSMQNFSTQNAALAVALATAGCQFTAVENGGPATNLYTVETLRAKGFGGRNLGIEEAAREAVAKDVPGIVTYMFVRSDLLSRCYKAWCDTEERLRDMEQEKQFGEVLDLSPEDITAVLCVGSRNRKGIMELAWTRSATIGTSKLRTEAQGDGKSHTTGVGKIWSLNASKETRRKLGL